MEVYSLVSSAKRYSPDFTQLPPGHRTCSFISHLNSPGSIQPGCHFRRTELFKHTSLYCPTRYPLTPGSREYACEQSAFPRSTTSKHVQRSRGSNPRSLACKSGTVPLSHNTPLPMYVICLVDNQLTRSRRVVYQVLRVPYLELQGGLSLSNLTSYSVVNRVKTLRISISREICENMFLEKAYWQLVV